MAQPFLVSRAEVRRVIAASSAGTVFEWYDFYLYAVLAPFFAKLFFPPDNETAALLAAFAAYAAGFLVRPLGAVVLGRLGDLAGRKYTLLISIVIMGFATFTVGLLPTFDQLGWISPDFACHPQVDSGVCAWRRIWGCCDLCRGIYRRLPPRLHNRLGSGNRDLGASAGVACDWRLPRAPHARGVRGLGMAAALRRVDCPSAYLYIYPR